MNGCMQDTGRKTGKGRKKKGAKAGKQEQGGRMTEYEARPEPTDEERYGIL